MNVLIIYEELKQNVLLTYTKRVHYLPDVSTYGCVTGAFNIIVLLDIEYKLPLVYQIHYLFYILTYYGIKI